MSIHKKTFFDYRTSQQKEKDYQEFQKLMFPLGEAQRYQIERALRYAPRRCSKEKLMFQFLVTKERYLECQMEDMDHLTCCREAYSTLRKFQIYPNGNLPYVLALALLDLCVEDLKAYPRTDEIISLSLAIFPAGPKKPDWSGSFLDDCGQLWRKNGKTN